MKVSIKDIAKELNLAVSTISRALNGSYGVHPKTIERVQQKAREMGYVPDLGAKQLVGKSSKLIGIFMPEFEFEATPEFHEFFPPLHKAPAGLAAAGDFSGASGARAALELYEKDPAITAICCANDLMAMGAIMALSQQGVRVPEDISVAGYDGAFFTAYTNPPLTTIRHANERIGIRAVEMLIELLNGGTGRRESVPPVLVERQSVVEARKL